jgi:hypothetical protein
MMPKATESSIDAEKAQRSGNAEQQCKAAEQQCKSNLVAYGKDVLVWTETDFYCHCRCVCACGAYAVGADITMEMRASTTKLT